MFLVFFNTPPKHILFYTKKINMRTKTTRQYRVKSSISKYILSNNSSYALHVERDNSIIYQNIPNIPTNIPIQIILKLVARKTRSQDKHLPCTKYKIYIPFSVLLLLFRLLLYTQQLKRKEKRKQDKIQLDVFSILYSPFCVPHFVFLIRHDLYIHLSRSYLPYLVFDVLLSIAYGNLSTYIYNTYCCFLT